VEGASMRSGWVGGGTAAWKRWADAGAAPRHLRTYSHHIPALPAHPAARKQQART